MPKPAEVELDNYWRALALLRESKAGDTLELDKRYDALSELEAIVLYTTNTNLRARCRAVLNAETQPQAKVLP